jgi:hypothetical protein
MAFTTTDLNNIDAAIATGELSIEHNGRKVQYRSIDDLLKARNTIAAGLAASTTAAASGPGVRRGSFRVNFSTHRGD